MEEIKNQIDFIMTNMIEGFQVETKMHLENKLSLPEASDLLQKKYDTEAAEVIENSLFEQQMQIGNFEA